MVIIGVLHFNINSCPIFVFTKQIKNYRMCPNITQETLCLCIYYLQFWLLEDDPQDLLANSIIFGYFVEKHIIYYIQLFDERLLLCTCLQCCRFLSFLKRFLQ